MHRKLHFVKVKGCNHQFCDIVSNGGLVLPGPKILIDKIIHQNSILLGQNGSKGSPKLCFYFGDGLTVEQTGIMEQSCHVTMFYFL